MLLPATAPGTARRAAFIGVYTTLVSIGMLFAALTTAIVFQRGLDNWRPLDVPRILWLNTAVLLSSSAAFEAARRCLRGGLRGRFNALWLLGGMLGAGFLAGQCVAWRELRVPGGPSAPLFYLLTATHALHILAGLIAVSYVGWRALRLELGPGRRTAAEATVLYWHFMDCVWLYVMLLLPLWK